MPDIAHVHTYTFDELAEIVVAPLYAKFGDVSVAISEDRVMIWIKNPVPLAAGEAAPVQTRAVVDREEMDAMVDAGDIVEESDQTEETEQKIQERSIHDEPTPFDKFFYNPELDRLMMVKPREAEPDPEDGWEEIDEAKYLDIRSDLDRQRGMDLGGGNSGAGKAQDEREDNAEGNDKPKGGPLAQRAGIICGEKAFWRFMDCKDQDEVVDEIRAACGIKSRAELDSNKKAADKFKDIDTRYKNWLNGND